MSGQYDSGAKILDPCPLILYSNTGICLLVTNAVLIYDVTLTWNEVDGVSAFPILHPYPFFCTM